MIPLELKDGFGTASSHKSERMLNKNFGSRGAKRV
jgi:hypothetical protein